MITRLLKRLRLDRRGAAAVEFAFIAPVMITLYFGLAEVTMAMMAERRASHLAATLADLVAQDAQVDKLTLDEIVSAGPKLMDPFPSTGLNVCISGVVADAEGKTTIEWSKVSGACSTRDHTPGAVVVLPDDLLANSEGLVMAEVAYHHTPIVGYVLDKSKGMDFKEVFYLRPRQATKVACSDCNS
ncbi:MAG TPA: TadE/TadG family type IV pilus assembly protein [Phenylobacterium sp.]